MFNEMNFHTTSKHGQKCSKSITRILVFYSSSGNMKIINVHMSIFRKYWPHVLWAVRVKTLMCHQTFLKKFQFELFIHLFQVI